MLGLLDPLTGPEGERWALRRREILRLQEALNPPAARALTEDKALFAPACERHGLPAAPVVAVLEREAETSHTAEAWAAALERSAHDEFVVKPASGSLASGLRVLRRTDRGAADHAGRERSWAELAAELAAEPWDRLLVQPRLRTHPDILRLSGHDVLQCLRIVTLVDGEGRARVLYTALRIVVGDGPTDSFRAERGGTTGNLIARVEDDGRLALPVGVAPSGFGLVRVARHPDTGVTITGVPVPGIAEARALAVRAAEVFRPLRTVGWDVAPTASGPVLLEGNIWWGASGDPDGALLPVRTALLAAASDDPGGISPPS